MELRPHRWKYSHPGIAICPKRLQMILAAGDMADQALAEPHMRRAYQAEHGIKLEGGNREDLMARRNRLQVHYEHQRAASRVEDNADELAKAKADLADATEALRAYESAEAAARNAQLAVILRRNRCAEYALETGLRAPELLKLQGRF